jgi:hypothetical protein
MFNKIVSFAMSVASRGLNNNKVDLLTKQLRYISCFGNEDIPQCPNLKKSNKTKFYYCGGCGCGDHLHTQLIKNPGEYAKLDYPSLNCPLKMPGFTNYDPNSPIKDLNRKELIQNYDLEKVKLVNITVSVDKEKEEIFDSISKINGNT